MVELIGFDNLIKSWGVKVKDRILLSFLVGWLDDDYATKLNRKYGGQDMLCMFLFCVYVWYNLFSSVYCTLDPQVGYTEGMTGLHLEWCM